MSIEVLVIDDEADIRKLIKESLEEEGYSVTTAANSQQALAAVQQKPPHIMILDIWLQGSDLDGLGILEIVKKKYPLLPVIVISGHGTIETAVTATKMGAYDYMEKPFTHDKLMIVLKRAYETSRIKRENLDLRSKVIDRNELIGKSLAIIKLKAEIEKVANTAGRVMLFGYVGSGKELAARLLHKKSKRYNHPFIVFSASGMTQERIAQELFGEYEKQENQEVTHRRLSFLEAAHNGTIYIDEITDLPIATQTRLLKFLQDQTIERSDCPKPIKLDVRFITATSRDIEQEIVAGRMRQDLYYRLNVVPIRVPKLSERKEDIPLLVEHFIRQLVKFSGLKERAFSDEAIAALQAYNWPGNIRQLRNVVEWTLIMNPLHGNADNVIIKPEMLPSEILNNGITIAKPETNMDMMSMSLREAREVFERQYLTAQMSRFNNNISKTSAFVGMERSALHRKLKLLNIHVSSTGKREEELEEEIA